MLVAKRTAAGQQKVWLLIGAQTGLHRATTRYLRSRGQTVFVLADLDTLSKDLSYITDCHDYVDMLIVNDLKKEMHIESFLRAVYVISDYMRNDGTSQVVFMLSDGLCFNHLKDEDDYQELKRNMNAKAIGIQCFEPG